MVKNLPANAGDARHTGSIPGSGRSPGGRHGNPLQDSCLKNSMYRGAKESDTTERAHTHTYTHNWKNFRQPGHIQTKLIRITGVSVFKNSPGDSAV